MKIQNKTNSPYSVAALWVVALLLICGTGQAWAQNQKVLIFSKTTVFHHQSIPAGIVAIQKLGAEHKFDVDTTTDATKFTDANLKQYAVLIFLSPTSPSRPGSKGVFDTLQKDAFKHFIEAGGGFVGIHSATDFGYDFPWYGQLVGGYFLGHPRRNVQEAVINVVDTKSPMTKGMPAQWKRTDEYYSFKPGSNPKDLHVLLTFDESTEDYGTMTNLKMGDFHPLAWYHDYDGGRAFYTALGHTDETFADPLFLNHLLEGIKYAAGKKHKIK